MIIGKEVKVKHFSSTRGAKYTIAAVFQNPRGKVFYALIDAAGGVRTVPADDCKKITEKEWKIEVELVFDEGGVLCVSCQTSHRRPHEIDATKVRVFENE
jgi:hypothetical protein